MSLVGKCEVCGSPLHLIRSGARVCVKVACPGVRPPAGAGATGLKPCSTCSTLIEQHRTHCGGCTNSMPPQRRAEVLHRERLAVKRTEHRYGHPRATERNL